MKIAQVVVIATIGVFASCRTVPTSTTETTETESVEEVERQIGTVNLDPDCGVQIRVIKGDLELTYSAPDLEAKYAKQDMKLRITYVVTDMQLENRSCSPFKIIKISEVSAVR